MIDNDSTALNVAVLKTTLEELKVSLRSIHRRLDNGITTKVAILETRVGTLDSFKKATIVLITTLATAMILGFINQGNRSSERIGQLEQEIKTLQMIVKSSTKFPPGIP